jgi:hypothetical protein
MMKSRNLFVVCVLILLLVTACGQQQTMKQDIAVAVALTQTAAAAVQPTAATTTTPAVVNGTITGKVGLMAPPTPDMVVYALDPSSGKWASVDTSANENGMADFSLTVPPGSYQVFAFVKAGANGASATYSKDGQVLAPVTVAANQTVKDIMVQFPGQDECGRPALPGSPDGKFTAYPGPDPTCVAGVKATQQAGEAASSTSSGPTRVQFAANSSSWTTSGDLPGNGHVAFVLYALKGQAMTVSVEFTPSSGAYFFVRTADGRILLPSSNSSWTAALPGSQDYVVGIDNLPQQNIHYTLTISIPPASGSSSKSKAVYSPVSSTVCKTLQELAVDALSTSFAMQTGASFKDPVSQESGTGCTLTATGTGEQFSDPGTVTASLVNGFQGWDEKTAYQAGGPTGAATGMTRDMGLLLINVTWSPAAGITCPNDQPISECDLTPAQKVYIITVQAAQK